MGDATLFTGFSSGLGKKICTLTDNLCKHFFFDFCHTSNTLYIYIYSINRRLSSLLSSRNFRIPPSKQAGAEIWAVGFLFCGKATAVETCHRHVSKSRLSNPTFGAKNNSHPNGWLLFWRRRWDSNPRGVLPPTRFRVELVMTTSILLRIAPVLQALIYFIMQCRKIQVLFPKS